MAAADRNGPHGEPLTPDPLQCSCVVGHISLASTVITVTIVIALMLIAVIPIAVAFSLPRCPMITFFSEPVRPIAC
jgi:hypothetical protein